MQGQAHSCVRVCASCLEPKERLCWDRRCPVAVDVSCAHDVTCGAAAGRDSEAAGGGDEGAGEGSAPAAQDERHCLLWAAPQSVDPRPGSRQAPRRAHLTPVRWAMGPVRTMSSARRVDFRPSPRTAYEGVRARLHGVSISAKVRTDGRGGQEGAWGLWVGARLCCDYSLAFSAGGQG